jgi:lipid-A-disaccharide synthase-like uncharacterized protein
MSAGYATLMLHEPYLDMAISEDNFFETVGFLGLFFTAILFIMAFRRSRYPENRASNPRIKQLSYFVLALIFIFGAGEEISWGQRLFDIETPPLLQKENVQDEINIHNLKMFEQGSHTITMDTLFTTFAMTFTFLIPFVASRSKSLDRLINRVMPVPHWYLGLLFVANFLLAKLAGVIFVSFYENPAIPFGQGVQEIKESNYAVLFVFVAAYITVITLKPRAIDTDSLAT